MKFISIIGLVCIATIVYADCDIKAVQKADGGVKMNVNCGSGTLYSCDINGGSASCRGFFGGTNKVCSTGLMDNQNAQTPTGQCCLTFMDCQSKNCDHNICV